MSGALKGVIALVTGAGSGLGQATASRIISQGGKVAFVDLAHQADAVSETLKSLNAGENGFFCPADVVNPEQISNALDEIESKYGRSVNTVVNCAGIAIAARTIHPKRGPHSLEDFMKVITVNIGGTFNVNRLAAEKMSKAEANEGGQRGVLINTASVAAYDGQIGQVAYASSKGGIVGMTLPMARDLSKNGIRVMTIAPGLFLTPMLMSLPEKIQNELAATVPNPSRLGNPDEYAQLVQSVIENPMLNGEVIRIDGALRMQP